MNVPNLQLPDSVPQSVARVEQHVSHLAHASPGGMGGKFAALGKKARSEPVVTRPCAVMIGGQELGMDLRRTSDERSVPL